MVVVGGCASGVKAYGLAYNEGDGLGLRLPHRLGGGSATFGLVQHLVRELVNQGAEAERPQS